MVKIKYLCKSFSTPLTQENLKEEALYPVYGAAGLMGYMDNYSADKEYIGVVKDGAGVGRIDKYPEKSSLLGTMAYIFPNEGTDIDWLKYALMSLELGKNIGATTIPHIYFSQYGNKYVNTPNYNQQQKIANFLDSKCASIDAVIEKTKASIEEYKKLKQAIITQAVTKGIRPNRKMKDSGIEWIGKIPEKWGIPKIKYMAQIASGSTPDRNRPEYWNGTIRWIKTGELQNNVITDSEEYITELALKETSVSLFAEDTILIAMYGQGKTRGMTALLAAPCTTNQACAGLTITSKNITVSYLWKCVMGAYNGIREIAQGTGQPNLNAKLVSDFHIPLPPIEEQEEIVSFLEKKIPEINMLITKKEIILTEMEFYKKSLIYEYVTGKKEVSNCY